MAEWVQNTLQQAHPDPPSTKHDCPVITAFKKYKHHSGSTPAEIDAERPAYTVDDGEMARPTLPDFSLLYFMKIIVILDR